MKSLKTALFLVFLLAGNLVLSAAIPASERQALIDLYNSTNGAYWANQTGWKTPPLHADGFGMPGTEKTWYGITTDAGNTAVTGLSMGGTNLPFGVNQRGTLPSSLGGLSRLQYLDLSNHWLGGSIPASLGNLSQLLELNFFNNVLTGSIPSSLGNLSNLQELTLSANALSGSIPTELGFLNNLRSLYLHSNQLTGSIPSSLGNLSRLQFLYLNINGLTGSIPAELGNLSGLLELNLFNNQLTGIIPASLGSLNILRSLELHSNGLSGGIPPSLGNLSNLQELNLSATRLAGNIPTELGNLKNLTHLNLCSADLTGGIPASLGNLSSLQHLDLWNNVLSGSIPAELGNLSNLQYLSLTYNELTGSIPTELGNLSNLNSLFLDSNWLTGDIPPSLGNLSHLTRLALYFNYLTGSIPSSLGNLSSLLGLDLSSNLLTGVIPTELGHLSALGSLALGYNQLTGSIPTELGGLGSLVVLDLGFNQLTGNIPASFSKLSSLTYLKLYSNRLTGSIPTELGNLNSLQMLGLSSNYLTGSIPATLTNLSLNTIRLRYNALYSSDAGLTAFLNSKDSDWSATQTIAPTNLSAVPGGASATVSWTPIPYTGDTGGYRVYYATIGGGPYTFFAQTSTKSASSQLVTGLTPGIPYYFVVQTHTNIHANNQNVVDSETSAEATATPLIPVSLTVTSPNGGESWIVGSVHNITWTSTGTIGNVKIDYSTDSGVNWTTVIASTANTGTYPWTVPNTPSTNCLVRASEAASGIPSDASNAVFTITANEIPIIRLSKTSFKFGSVQNGTPTKAQTSLINNAGTGTLNWVATPSANWISVSPPSGTGTGALTITIVRTDMQNGLYEGTISITDPHASNSPQTINIELNVLPSDGSEAPFGHFDTPINETTVMSSIPVTGWVLDDIEAKAVKIYRNPVGTENPIDGRVYIGDGLFSEGSRPDVELKYPSYPLKDRAGWGYMLLTNFLPNGGNGTFTLYAYATDKEGHEVLLGSKTITCDNLHAVKPFGAIDWPGQGAQVSGSAYINAGWALTPKPNSIPTDGSTIMLWVDSLPIGHPSYNHFRDDIARLFPGYANSNGAVGVYALDTTAFANGVHTMAWSVRDNAGNEDGIGSRYFTILNTGSSSPLGGAAGLRRTSDLDRFLDISPKPIHTRRGYDRRLPPDPLRLKPSGEAGSGQGAMLPIRELERVEILLDDEAWSLDAGRRTAERAGVSLSQPFSRSLDVGARWLGYLVVGDELRPLPIGSTFDSAAGVFSWLPGPGFLGDYPLVFVDLKRKCRVEVTVRIGPLYARVEK